MAHPYHHALSSVRKWGGVIEDYQPIHDWFDASKMIIADFRHRALRHHAEGIFLAETIFGATITLSTGRVIPLAPISLTCRSCRRNQHAAASQGEGAACCGPVLSPQRCFLLICEKNCASDFA
jgi:uncharacterized protein DUF6915